MDYNYVNNSVDYSNTAANTGIYAGLAAFLAAYMFVALILAVFVTVAMWKVFTKAGKPGWAAIIPIYNFYILLEIVGRPTWWLAFVLLSVIPVVGPIAALVVGVIVSIDLAKSFGKDTGFGILLALLPIVGYPMLAWSKNINYVGPAAKMATNVAK